MADQQIYTVEIDGRQYDLQGDHPPSEAEARAAVGSTAAAAPQTAHIAPVEHQQGMLSKAADVAIGAFKQPGRLVQMIPGVAAGTDALYGLPPGASEQAMQPMNTPQRVGGWLADVGEIAAAGAADAGMVYTRNTLGQFVRAPYMSSIAGRAAGMVGDTASAAASAAAKELGLGSGAPMTAARVGSLAGHYGIKAAKTALGVTGLMELWKHL